MRVKRWHIIVLVIVCVAMLYLIDSNISNAARVASNMPY